MKGSLYQGKILLSKVYNRIKEMILLSRVHYRIKEMILLSKVHYSFVVKFAAKVLSAIQSLPTVKCRFSLRALSSAGSHKTARVRASARFILTAMLLASAPALLGGCALAESGGSLALEELPGQGARLAGVFVTSKHIEPGPSELEFNSRGDIRIKDTGSEKIYGSFTGYDAGEPVVTFPGLEGYGIYSLTAPEDETHEATGARYMTTDFHFANVHYYVLDQEDSVEADLYITADSHVAYYFNPVYQQEDGQIYLLAGSGVTSQSFNDGQKFNHSISESTSHRSNEETLTRSQKFSVNIIASEAPQETELLLMDGENRLIKRYSEEQLAELTDAGASLTLPGEASYLILRQTKAGEEHGGRTLIDQDAEYVEYMAPAGNDILYFRQLPLIWP